MSTQQKPPRSPREFEARQWLARTKRQPDRVYEIVLAEARDGYADAVAINQRFDEKADAWSRVLATLLAFVGAASLPTGLGLPVAGLLLTAVCWFAGLCAALFMRRSFDAPSVPAAPALIEYLHDEGHEPDQAQQSLAFFLAKAYYVSEVRWRDLNLYRDRGNWVIGVCFAAGTLAFVGTLIYRAVAAAV